MYICLGFPNAGWTDAVVFDRDIRSENDHSNANGSPLRGTAYLHCSCPPLDQAPIDRVTAHEWAARQIGVFGPTADAELEQSDLDGCSPWACRSGTEAAL